MTTGPTYEAVVIGSGFGGAITACRLAKKWPGRVLVLERGQRFPMGTFPRTPAELAEQTWSVNAGEDGPAFRKNRGLFDGRRAGRMDAIVAAGLGGGSLIYSNVFLAPPPTVFNDPRWPGSCSAAALTPYYEVAKEVLGARPVPLDDGERRVRRAGVFDQAANELGKPCAPTEVNVFFGPDPAGVLDPGLEADNRYGARQTSCTYCGECNVGCNLHAKNTLDLNYLYRAERAHGATILTDHQVEGIVPVNGEGTPDPAADGTHGYLVTSRNLDSGETEQARAARVVVAAGTLGTVELLLRARDVERTLPRLPAQVGEGFSGNGDFLMFVRGIDPPTDPCRGPTITRYIDHGLFSPATPHGFLMQDSGYPTFLAWFVEGAKPRILTMPAVARAATRVFNSVVRGRTGGRVGTAFGALLARGLTEGSAVLLCMGRDSSTGTLRLGANNLLTGRWSVRENLRLYRAITAAGKAFNGAVGGERAFAAPTWWPPLRRTVTVHPLGGCRLADSVATGVTSAAPDQFGQVFGYPNLYVADGSLLPTSIGANPSATISALAERVAHGITGEPPDPDL